MARRFKIQDNPNWLWSGSQPGAGVVVEALIHDERYLEIKVYDYDAPKSLRWTITVMDRETGRTITVHAPLNEQQVHSAALMTEIRKPIQQVAAA